MPFMAAIDILRVSPIDFIDLPTRPPDEVRSKGAIPPCDKGGTTGLCAPEMPRFSGLIMAMLLADDERVSVIPRGMCRSGLRSGLRAGLRAASPEAGWMVSIMSSDNTSVFSFSELHSGGCGFSTGSFA